MTPSSLASYIDHTNLHPETTSAEIELLCEEAKKFQFPAVCINPCHVGHASKVLADSNVAICTVVGFPLGANTTEIKVAETIQAIQEGATEIDMVLNLGMVQEGNDDYVRNEIREIRKACAPPICLKLILEMSALDQLEKQRCAQMGIEEKVDYLKTSTGTHKNGGATIEDVQLLMKLVKGTNVKVKAAGGIRDLTTALKYVHEGVSRIGTSAGVKIIKESRDAAN